MARSVGRPKLAKEDQKAAREKVRELWKPGDSSVTPGGLPEVWLPNPPGKKGTTQYKAWAMESFIELVKHGWNYSQAAEKLGYDYQWWYQTGLRHDDWKQEVLAIRAGEIAQWEYPDLSKMPFHEFAQRYFGVNFAAHQLEIARMLEDPMGRLVLILGFPEAGKSTMVSLWYPIYRLCQDVDLRAALVTKSGPKAQDLLTRIKRYLTEEHLYDGMEGNLIADFNGFKPNYGEGSWSQDQIFTRHRRSGERDPSIQTLGIGKQIYGTRLDLLILDDALVLENQVSQTMRERIDQWFTQEARSRAQRGQTVVNGTRLHPLDLYGQWKESWKEQRTFFMVSVPAILDEWTPEERVSWPEYWTLDGYMQKDEDGVELAFQPGMRDIRAEITARDPARWKLVYQQQDINLTEAVFRKEHVDNAMDIGSTRKLGQVLDNEILILGVDPATTGRAAAVLVAYNPKTQIRTVVDLFVGSRLGAVGVRNDLLFRFWEKYKDHRVEYTVVESNFVPTLLTDETLKARAEAAGTRIIDHKTVARGKQRGSKWDEEYGIGAMASLFGGGLIAFASAGADDRVRLQPLVDDMLTFPMGRRTGRTGSFVGCYGYRWKGCLYYNCGFRRIDAQEGATPYPGATLKGESWT